MNNVSPPVEPAPSQAAPDADPVRRPASVTLLAFGVLIITAINIARLVLSLRYWSFLASQPGISPWYLALSGLIWSVAGSVLVWGLGTAKKWSPRLMPAVALTYALYYWLDLLFLKDRPVGGSNTALRLILPTNWQFSAGVTIVCLAYMVWVLSRPKVKAYFHQAEPEKTDVQATDNNTSGI